MDMTGDPSSDSFWCLSHGWRPGYPESSPQYLHWNQYEWQKAVERRVREFALVYR
jgi:hypothetical protein